MLCTLQRHGSRGGCWHRWASPPSQEGLQALAAATPGWAGADLKALCASAVLAAARRSCPVGLAHMQDEREWRRSPALPSGDGAGADVQPAGRGIQDKKAWETDVQVGTG